MLRCGYCEKICDSYEDWLSHLVSEEHQANLGINDIFIKHNKDQERNERTIIMHKMNPKTYPYDVVCHFAAIEPLGFVTDAYVHIFPHVNEKFYMIVFDQRKFAQRIATLHDKCGDQKVVTSMVNCKRKSSLTESEWNSKLEQSFFYRRHEYLKRKLIEMNWDEQLENLSKFICLEQDGYQQRENVMEELETLIREEFHEATASPFGSCTTWLADVNADLDVYVDALGDKGRSELDTTVKLDIMNKIANLLRKKYDGKNVVPIRNARVPIIKLSHPSGLKIDISFENCLSVQNSKMIRLMTKLDYRVRRLLVFLRYWAKFHNLIGPQSVKSYALIMMTFVYLRREKLLPSVHELQHIEGINEFTVCNWNASYCGSRELTYKYLPWLKGYREPPSSEGMGHEVMKLAYGFFKEYAAFDFDTQVICPITGTFLPKSSFESTFGKDLPSEMVLLKANLATSQCSPFNTGKPLCVQDPFELNVNVTASCKNTDVVTMLKAACAMAAEALKPFITSYGLAGTESFLELCCQPVTDVKKMEIIMGASIDTDTNNHDLLAYVKTEATSSTHENEWDMGDNSTANAIAEAAVSSNSRYRDEYSERSYNFDTDRDRFDSRRRDRDRNRDDERPMRIQRTSMYDDSRDRGDRKLFDSYEQDRNRRFDEREPSPPGESNYNSTREEEEEQKRRALKSTVVVAGKSVNVKTEVTSSLSPSSSSSTREKSKASRVKNFVDSPASSSPRENNPRESSGSSADKPLTESKNSSGNIQNSKNYKEIVVFVERKQQAREVMNFQTASVSSPPVLYNQNQTVKFVDKVVEPVVKFVQSETPVPNFPKNIPPPPPPPPPPTVKVEIKEEPCYEEDNEDEVDELEEVDKFLHSLHQIEPADESSVSFDNGGSSYGYERAVQPAPKQVLKPSRGPYVPPQARNQAVENPPPLMQGQSLQPAQSRPMLCFPAFSFFMNDTYQQQFMNIVSIINIPEAVRNLKMRILWINSLNDFFSDTNFWVKFSPIYPASSFESNRLDKAEVIFQMAAKKQAELLEKNSQLYSYINYSRKRDFGSTDNNSVGNGTYGPDAKMLKFDPAGPQANIPFEYHHKADILMKVSKIPINTRKPYAVAYFFACRPEIMETLYSQWQKMSPTLTTTQSPLDLFGKMCAAVKRAVPPVPASPDDFILSIKLLVAFDTNGEVPGVYFGFESTLPQDHPGWKLQDQFNQRFQSILSDLIPSYVNHRLQKYFKTK